MGAALPDFSQEKSDSYICFPSDYMDIVFLIIRGIIYEFYHTHIALRLDAILTRFLSVLVVVVSVVVVALVSSAIVLRITLSNSTFGSNIDSSSLGSSSCHHV